MCPDLNAFRIKSDNPEKLCKYIVELRNTHPKFGFYALDQNIDNINIHLHDNVDIESLALLLLLRRM